MANLSSLEGSLPRTLRAAAKARQVLGTRGTQAVYRSRVIIELHSQHAWREVLGAMPIPYNFSDVEEKAHDPVALIPGHYLAVPTDGR